jgi:hypothetical protein
MFKTILLAGSGFLARAGFLAGSGAVALAACSGSMPDTGATQDAVDRVAPSDAAPAPAAGKAAPEPPPPTVAGPIDKTEQGARAVLVTWARALEDRQYSLAWAQFIDPPASEADFTRWWQRYRTIRVSLGPGESDAAMGSIYYTAPATLTGTTVAGKPFRLQGDVVVRRVNDVDGATPAQLRWHIGSADLKNTQAP